MTTANLITEYWNGNCKVSLHEDGTKIREYDGIPSPEFPESIDLKITDYCDAGCGFCHEKSTIHGRHALEDEIIRMLDGLPPGVELAIGGGNPASYPDWKLFRRIKEMGLIANMTVHCTHLYRYRQQLINHLQGEHIRGLGVSVANHKEYAYWRDFENSDVQNILANPNVVYHVIAGIFPSHSLVGSPFIRREKVLILGYKQYGFGTSYFGESVEKSLAAWRFHIGAILQDARSVSFDNLAIEQLGIRELVSPQVWEESYMGDDGTFTMYVDAVRREYAKSSTSVRHKLGKLSIKEAFQNIRRESIAV